MKTIVVMDSVSRAGGGLLGAERGLQQALRVAGIGVSVFSLRDEQTEADLPAWEPLRPKAYGIHGPVALGVSRAMQAALMQEDADLIYRAGIWRMPSKYAHQWSKRKGTPEIVAPHGMLDPWAVRNSRWKKRIASLWFERAHLRDAACLRALCESEAKSMRAYGLKNPIAIIPNGVDLVKAETLKAEKLKSERKILLFLGRIHPKKGLLQALRAWAEVGADSWQFVIAGWDQGGHRSELEQLCREIGVSVASVSVEQFLTETRKNRNTEEPASCLFTGPAFGDEKDALLRRADAFILPSFSEGLPMAVLEAWAYGLPVVMTDHCNLPEGFAADAAIRIGTEAERERHEARGRGHEAGSEAMGIEEGMRMLMEIGDGEREAMGARGRRLVEERFTWPQVAAQMKEVYEWVLGGGERPGGMMKDEG